MLRRAVGSVTGLAPDAISIVERPGNSPQLNLAGYAGPSPYCSLSHSGNWIACAVSLDATLGLDIERIDPARDIDAMSEIAFDASERAWLGRQPDAERRAAFHHLWSLKEAHYKLRAGQKNRSCNLKPLARCLSTPLVSWPDRAALGIDTACHMQICRS
ncbi:4'-phosphopantetheinyl transferase family protein [Undibacterium arcticum]